MGEMGWAIFGVTAEGAVTTPVLASDGAQQMRRAGATRSNDRKSGVGTTAPSAFLALARLLPARQTRLDVHAKSRVRPLNSRWVCHVTVVPKARFRDGGTLPNFGNIVSIKLSSPHLDYFCVNSTPDANLAVSDRVAT